jgi:DNA-binding transcriptional LysR family regulator
VLIDRYAAEHAFHPTIAYEVDGMRTIKGMVEAGLGYTVFSYAGVYEEVTAGTLRAIPLDPPMHWYLAMVTRTATRRPRGLVRLQGIVRRQVAEMYKSGYWRGELVVAQQAKP